MYYTIGNWVVEDLITDTNTATKNIAVPDLTWADYAKTQDEPNEAIVANTTSLEVTSPETVRFACSNVANIYDKTSIDPTMQASVKAGTQVMTELKYFVRATNQISGQEILLPFKGRTVLVIPKFPAVTAEAVEYALKRTHAINYDSDGSIDASRVIELTRGSLLPR
jgi:hypothetical protein